MRSLSATNVDHWEILRFDQLTTARLYALLQLRSEIFVVEQQCWYQDLDGLDYEAIHILGLTGTEILCYARILPPGSRFQEASIGRVISRASRRRSGLGLLLMKRAIEECVSRYPDVNIRISAQAYLLDFYQRLGFEKASEIYLEDGIPHLEMLRARGYESL